MRVRKVSSDDVKLYDLTQVKLKTAGTTQVIQFTAGNNKSCPVRNLSKDEYLDKKTGEIKEKNKSENRQQVPKSVRKSINKLMDLIRCNATDSAKCKWITFIYDADGNMIYGPLDGVMTEFTYDCRNRLIKAGDTTYEYDADDNRIAVQTEINRTEYTVENNMALLSQVLKSTEYDVTGGTVSREGRTTYFVYGSGLLAQENEVYGYLTYHFNNIGSTTAITNELGELVRVYTYGAYGELLSGDAEGISFLYNGQYGVITDKNNLYYMRARYYNIDIKRFINQDVLTGTITSSPSLNRYSYCEGNPISLSDPFGLSPYMLIAGLNGLLGLFLEFTPVVGDVIAINQGMEQWKEGNYGQALLCFVSALPLAGDIIGLGVKGFTKCDKLADCIRYGARMVTGGTFAVVGGYNLGYSVGSLFRNHVADGQEWTAESVLTVGAAVLYGALTALSVKGFEYNYNKYSNVYESVGPAWCFVKGTLVHTSAGTTPIEEIEPGDYVLAYNEETGESAYQKVVRLFRNTTDELAHVEVAGNEVSGESEEILCTPGHKFYVEGEWIAAGELDDGDILTLADGTTTEVISVEVEELATPVIIYNFEVENWHNYYVADSGVLVHNMKCGPKGESGRISNLDDGLNFSNRALEHMGESGRQVPIQTLQDAIRYGEAMPDPRGSNATMYYTTMYKNGKMYNLEVLYDKVSNTVYHFEYARKAMGNLPAIPK